MQKFAVLFNLPQFLLQPGNSRADSAPVCLQLLLPRTSGSDTASQPGQCVSGSLQAGQPVLKLRQFHLYLSFARMGPPGENVQNQHRTVKNSTFQ